MRLSVTVAMSEARFRACVVGQQRERRDLARPVAVLAVLLEDAHDLAVIRRRRLSALSAPRAQEPRPEEQDEARSARTACDASWIALSLVEGQPRPIDWIEESDITSTSARPAEFHPSRNSRPARARSSNALAASSIVGRSRSGKSVGEPRRVERDVGGPGLGRT